MYVASTASHYLVTTSSHLCTTSLPGHALPWFGPAAQGHMRRPLK